MSEELIQRGLSETGLKIGPFEFYNIGNTTLNQLKKYKIIPDKEYGSYGTRKPDAILVDRRNKNKIKVVLTLEHKDSGKFKSIKDKVSTTQQCNDVAQLLGSDIGISTDGTSFIWFNPNEESLENEYTDPNGTKRSYSLIKDEKDKDFIKELIIDQKKSEEDISALSPKTRTTLQYIETLKRHITKSNSKINTESTINPTSLAKQIWQDVWSVSGATPERCLYTFVEIFIFKYLSDLDILEEDDKGNKVNFRDIIKLSPDKAFKNYSENVRPYLKQMFPASIEDGTTIINGTVLNPKVPEHSKVFFKILKKFESFGEMKNIDPGFKSKVFEDFMKESISKKNWGQYFTPRNIIDAIIEISDINLLEDGAEVCDPACGVGGFILEPIKLQSEGVNAYYRIEDGGLKPRFNFSGFDKGFEKEEQLTIILAKANMLIFVSDLLKNNPTLSTEFAKVFNETFKLLSNTILGTLSKIEKDKYDLILTNPPYVTSGSSNYKEAIKIDHNLSDFYRVNGIGVEGLFMEWIVRSLKPGKKAFAIIPDGILHRLHDNKLREFIKQQCFIDGIISLPVNAFYTTPKKTYILAITKKKGKTEVERSEEVQTEPVFTYLVSNIGETLNVNRFPIEENDLIEAVSLFNQFKGAKKSFKSSSYRCKIQPIEKFIPDSTWTVDRFWTKEEKIDLGIEEEIQTVTAEQYIEKTEETKSKIDETIKELKKIKINLPKSTITLMVDQIFDLDESTNSSFFTKQFVDSNKGNIPVFSTSKDGKTSTYGSVLDNLPNVKYFENILTWNIDGSVGKAFFREGRFTLSEKVIPLILRQEWKGSIDYQYVKYALEQKSIERGFNFSNKAGKTRIKDIEIDIPAKMLEGKLVPDIDKQKELAKKYKDLLEIKENLNQELENLSISKVVF